MRMRDGEVVVAWTCPACKHWQEDSVHPRLGPWFSCICGKCEESFENHQLKEMDAAAWEEARSSAEKLVAQ